MKKINKLKSNYIVIIIILILGVFLMLFPAKNDESDMNSLDTSLVLETRICDMLKDTYNVDKVSVILTYDSNGEKIYSQENKKDILGKTDDLAVKSEKLPYVRGALIAVNNIDHETSEKIKEAIAVLLGVSKEKVIVIYNREV